MRRSTGKKLGYSVPEFQSKKQVGQEVETWRGLAALDPEAPARRHKLVPTDLQRCAAKIDDPRAP